MTRGVKFHPERFFTVKSFVNLSTSYCYRVYIIAASGQKLCCQTQIWVLNLNLGSKFSQEQWEEILTSFQNEAALLKWCIRKNKYLISRFRATYKIVSWLHSLHCSSLWPERFNSPNCSSQVIQSENFPLRKLHLANLQCFF